MLFEKFRRGGVVLLKSEETADGLIIRVKYKDLKKAFAILGNMWYNKPIRYHGAIGAWAFFKRHAATSVSAALFVLFCFLINGRVLFYETSGASQSKSAAITSLIDASDINLLSAPTETSLKKLQTEILKNDPTLDFVTVRMVGNVLKVEVRERAEATPLKERSRDIRSSSSGVITSISVYRGKALKKVGDTVLVGESVIKGVIADEETEYETYAVGSFTVRCESSFEIPVADNLDSTAAAHASQLKALLCREDASYSYGFVESGGSYILNLIITYSVTENGGSIE